MGPKLLLRQSKLFLTAAVLFVSVVLIGSLCGWKDPAVTVSPAPVVSPALVVSAADIRQAVGKSFLLLEQSGYTFTARASTKCAGCHHTTLTAMVAEMARQKDIPVIDSLSAARVAAMENNLHFVGNPNVPDQFLAVNFIAPYTLPGLYAEKYPASVYTDISVDYLMSQAKADGSFLAESGRVPLESGDIHLTAFAIRSIMLYASMGKKTRVDEQVGKTRHWLESQTPDQQQEIVFQLLGMQWTGSDKGRKAKVAQKLLVLQNADGGWSQLPTLKSDAYATGQAMYALYESGMIRSGDEAYQKGLSYLLKTEDKSGAWIVQTRSYPIQPFFTCDFPPYDENQFISAAATNWADLALLEALPDKGK